MTSRQSSLTVQVIIIITVIIYFGYRGVKYYKINHKRTKYSRHKPAGENIDELFYRIVNGLDEAQDEIIQQNEHSVSGTKNESSFSSSNI